jgi:hypothetical protein
MLTTTFVLFWVTTARNPYDTPFQRYKDIPNMPHEQIIAEICEYRTECLERLWAPEGAESGYWFYRE